MICKVMERIGRFGAAAGALMAIPAWSYAQDLGTIDAPLLAEPVLISNEELARKVQNPISDLTSALLENNLNQGFGITNGLQYVGNLEEFYPIKLTNGVNLVQRFIIPVISQPETVPGQGSHGGLGDIQYQAYFSTSKSKGLIYGVGPIVSIPSAYPNELGSRRWSIGPALAIVGALEDWVIGVLGNELVSVSTSEQYPNVNQMQLQPFVNFYLANAWYLSSSPVITANWQESNGNRWTVPAGGGVGKVFKIDGVPIKTEVQGFTNVISPQQGPDWSARIQIQVLFPSIPKGRT
jgi:hypothetical protein